MTINSSPIHELQVEVVAGRGARVGAGAEAFVAYVQVLVGAGDVYEKEVLPVLLVIDIAKSLKVKQSGARCPTDRRSGCQRQRARLW
jgi:hypothetical protein